MKQTILVLGIFSLNKIGEKIIILFNKLTIKKLLQRLNNHCRGFM